MQQYLKILSQKTSLFVLNMMLTILTKRTKKFSLEVDDWHILNIFETVSLIIVAWMIHLVTNSTPNNLLNVLVLSFPPFIPSNFDIAISKSYFLHLNDSVCGNEVKTIDVEYLHQHYFLYLAIM